LYAKNIATKNIAMVESNPFKFGSVVDDPYFTNRVEELKQIGQVFHSANHLILISPRRFGKTSLVMKAVKSLDRPYLFLDLQLITDIKDFAVQMLRRIYRIYPFEHLKQLVKNFRIVPSLTINPLNNAIDIEFQPVSTEMPLLEDVFNLLEKLGDKRQRPIVILDEFQDIKRIDARLDRKLRSFIQHHENVNYVFLGSFESMMREIFEKKKSPFYHFGQLLLLDKIPRQEFKNYLVNGFNGKCENAELLSEKFLGITDCNKKRKYDWMISAGFEKLIFVIFFNDL
jgi:AAA+ ATPase superfamily predicted ATPase